jgi:excisionase family DNA binding protein
MNDRLLNVAEVAQLLGLSKGTVYHHVSERRIPCVRLSARCLRFRESEMQEFIKKLATERPIGNRRGADV